MTTSHLEFAFASDYAVRVLEELPPGRIPRFYYPGGSNVGGNDGIMVKVTPRFGGAEWIGVFAFGLLSPKGTSGVYACPSAKQLCVVARGAGYVVDSFNPIVCELVKAEPIFGVYPIPGRCLLVFSDYLHLVAYGTSGLAWDSDRLSWDGLVVDEVNSDWIRGRGWSSPRNLYEEFVVDTRTGHHQGGGWVLRTPIR